MYTAKKALLRLCLVVPALSVGLLYAVPAARAQVWDEPVTSNWSVKVGAFLPAQGTMRNQTSTAWWVVGVDWDPMFTHNTLDGSVFLSADIMMRSAGGTFVSIIPLTANIVWDITPDEAATRVYGGLGIGVYLVDPVYDSMTVQGGLRFILGMDLTPRVFLQVNYDYVSGFTDDRGAGLRADGVSAVVGCRF